MLLNTINVREPCSLPSSDRPGEKQGRAGHGMCSGAARMVIIFIKFL